MPMSENDQSGIVEDTEFHLPEHHSPLPELSHVGGEHPHPDAALFLRVQSSPAFVRLRRTFRTFAFPTVAAVLVWYFLYVLLSTFAEELMSIRVIGNLNIGILFGLAQFPTTWFATWLYVWRADRVIDPLAAELRAEIEAEATA